MILNIINTLQILFVLYFSKSEAYHKDIHFSLNVSAQGNNSHNPVVYNLTRDSTVMIKPNSSLSFECSISNTTADYVMLASRNICNVSKRLNGTDGLILRHVIAKAECQDSLSITCTAGNSNKTDVHFTSEIIIECPQEIIRFDSESKVVSTRKNQVNTTLICEEDGPPISLRIGNKRNITDYLNYTERSDRITYNLPIITCDDMGHYVCAVNRSISHQIEEKLLVISVNDCPPRMCSNYENVTRMLNNTSSIFVICVEVPINDKIIAVHLNGTWLQNNNCFNGICVQYCQDSDNQFRYQINITFKEENISDDSDMLLKIGSGYNFRNNYINFTIKRNRSSSSSMSTNLRPTTSYNTTIFDRPITELTQSSRIFPERSVQSSEQMSETGTRKGQSEEMIGIIVLVTLCLFTLVTGGVAYFYIRKVHRHVSTRSGPSRRFQYLARLFEDKTVDNGEVYCNTKKTMKSVKRKSLLRRSDADCESPGPFKAAQPNLYQKFRAKVRTSHPPRATIDSDAAESEEDSGRYLSDDGLIYVTLGSVNKKRRQKPKKLQKRRRKIKYAKLDYTKTGKLRITDESCEREDGEHVYQNVPPGEHVYLNVPVAQTVYQNVPAAQYVYQNVPVAQSEYQNVHSNV